MGGEVPAPERYARPTGSAGAGARRWGSTSLTLEDDAVAGHMHASCSFGVYFRFDKDQPGSAWAHSRAMRVSVALYRMRSYIGALRARPCWVSCRACHYCVNGWCATPPNASSPGTPYSVTALCKPALDYSCSCTWDCLRRPIVTCCLVGEV
jgi:hypothetical protein